MTTLRIFFLIGFFSIWAFIAPEQAVTATRGSDVYTLEDITWEKGVNSWTYRIKGGGKPTYTRYELFSPHRLRLDIAQGEVGEKLELPMKPVKGPVSLVRGNLINDKKLPIYRLELILAKDAEYNVRNQGNDILVNLDNSMEETGKKNAGRNNGQFISNINIKPEPGSTIIEIKAGKPIHSCEATEIAGDEEATPPRLILDLESVGTEEIVKKGPENSPFSQIKAEPFRNGSRLVIDSSSHILFDYDLLTHEKGLLIEVRPVDETKNLLAAITGGEGAKKKVSDSKPREIAPRVKKTEKEPKKEEITYQGDQFVTAGYSGEKVTVDFYQSELHNVFRLIGEVSGRNIIVAEGVSGTLTLSLKDVPWDFMLDIVLNLKNLNKEEQFNTIIISPASKKFEWPGQDEKDDLVISRPETSTRAVEENKGKIEAAKILRRAKGAEKAGSFQEALTYYEKFFNMNPERGDIAAKITSIALTELGLNSKAAHYGKIASMTMPDNCNVALLTATALAELGKPKEAVKYYELAASGPSPSAQALMAYATFSEEYRSYQMALELWGEYEKFYGASLETMVSRARITDLLGKKDEATEIYRSIKMSGYEIPSDLAKYINYRIKD